MKKCVFRKIDYNSGDGMLTSVWGPNLWHVLHMISFNYPINPTKEDKKNYMRFIRDLRYVLPCKYCRDNLNGNLRKLKFTMKSMKNRDTFSRFVYKLHNHVNKMLGKNNTVTFEEIRDRYEHFRARCLEKKNVTKKKQKGGKRKNKTKRKMKGGKKEKGCTKSLYGVKSMSVINIIPKRKGVRTLKIDPKCKYKRV